MAGPTQDERRVPPYVALIRIGAVLGMSFFAAGGILILLMGNYYWQGLASLALATPFFAVMRLAERLAEQTQNPDSLQ